MYADRQAFLTGVKRRFGEVFLPGLGQKVRFRSLSEEEQSDFELASEWKRDETGELYRDEVAVKQTRARLIILCLVDGEGNQVLCDTDIDQVMALDGKDIRLLFGEMQTHCGLVGREEEKKSDSKPSGTTNGNSLPTDSRQPVESPTSAA